jgi:hypothetical protein
MILCPLFSPSLLLHLSPYLLLFSLHLSIMYAQPALTHTLTSRAASAKQLQLSHSATTSSSGDGSGSSGDGSSGDGGGGGGDSESGVGGSNIIGGGSGGGESNVNGGGANEVVVVDDDDDDEYATEECESEDEDCAILLRRTTSIVDISFLQRTNNVDDGDGDGDSDDDDDDDGGGGEESVECVSLGGTDGSTDGPGARQGTSGAGTDSSGVCFSAQPPPLPKRSRSERFASDTGLELEACRALIAENDEATSHGD